MTRLYGHKWVSKEGEFPVDENGQIDRGHDNIYGFRVWFDCVKDFTDEQWRQGVDRIESNVREAARVGDESWPPSYEEFAAYATTKKSAKYWNGAPGEFVHSLPESKEAKEERKARGREKCSAILSIFNE